MSTHNIGFYGKSYLLIIIKYHQIPTVSVLLNDQVSSPKHHLSKILTLIEQRDSRSGPVNK